MANTLRFKRGLVSTIPTALAGEPLFTTDTFDLYIGNGTTNTRFQKYIASGTTSQLLRGDGSLLTMPIVLTSPSSGQVLKYNGTSWVNDSDAGITGSGAAGQVAYFTGATTQSGSNNLFWDSANSRLGIGTNVPKSRIHTLLNGNAANGITGTTLIGQNSSSGNSSYLTLIGAFDANAGIVFTDESEGYRGRIIYSNNNEFMSFWTDLAERMRLHATGNLHLGGTSDNGLRFQVTGDGYFSGSVGIGAVTLPSVSLRVSKNLTSGTSIQGVLQEGQVQADVTSVAYGFRNIINTVNSLTLGEYIHFYVQQGTIGTTNAITNQYGYSVGSNLTGATNNYGFYGNIASGTGRWNLYMNGTAANYLNGSLGIGTTTPSTALHVVQSSLQATFEGSTQGSIRIKKAGVSGVQLFSNAAGSLQFYNDNTGLTTANLDNSGNLGLGVTPSAWASDWRVIQVGTRSAIAQYATDAFITNNLYFDGAGGSSARYIASAAASMYQQSSGSHIWYNAPSGTSGNAITFTQAMTLDASGNLLVGMTSAPSDGAVAIKRTGTAAASIKFHNANTGDTGSDGLYLGYGGSDGTEAYLYQRENNVLIFGTNNAERIRLHADGNLAIGTVSNAGYKLDVNGTMRVSGAATFSSSITSATDISARNGDISIGLDTQFSTPYMAIGWGGRSNAFNRIYAARDATAGIIISAATGRGINLRTDGHAATGLYIASDGTTQLRNSAGNYPVTFDTLGNLSLGTNINPAAWGITSRALQIGSTTGLENWTGSTVLENNGFRNSAGDYKYLTTSFATSYAQTSNGRHEWYLAPSGTAGATITFFQAMTLFNDGNLVINDVNNAGFKLDVNGTFRATGAATFSSSVTSTQFRLSALNTAPATSSSTGTLGEIRIDADHIYVCTATNTWKRVAISTF